MPQRSAALWADPAPPVRRSPRLASLPFRSKSTSTSVPQGSRLVLCSGVREPSQPVPVRRSARLEEKSLEAKKAADDAFQLKLLRLMKANPAGLGIDFGDSSDPFRGGSRVSSREDFRNWGGRLHQASVVINGCKVELLR